MKIWNCYVGDMKTSAGMEYYVSIERKEDLDKPFFERKIMTPHMFKERWKAEYEVATWDAFLNGGEEPDILAYGPTWT